MAAHIMCHGNEILPSTFPPQRPSVRDHGMMSEYEAAIVSRSTLPHTGGAPTGMSDSEIMPVLNKPTPTYSHIYNLSDFGDPALCVTPEKKRAPLNRGSDEGTSMKPRNSQKVTFDNFVEVKQMSPDTGVRRAVSIQRDSPDPALELASRVDPAEQHDMDRWSATSEDLETPAAAITKNYVTDDFEPISVFASDLKSSKHYKNTSETVQTVPQQSSSRAVGSAFVLKDKSEHVLARPEFNSTLRVGKEIQQLEGAELDVNAAVKQKLKDSRKLKTAISDKVTAKVNTNSAQFQGLVSVELCEQNIISNTEKQKVAKTKPAIKTAKLEDTIVCAPDIMELLTSDLHQQTASLTLEGLPSRDNGPKMAQLSRAFDVYRHSRSWEGW